MVHETNDLEGTGQRFVWSWHQGYGQKYKTGVGVLSSAVWLVIYLLLSFFIDQPVVRYNSVMPAVITFILYRIYTNNGSVSVHLAHEKKITVLIFQ